jgi:hypothetical protein
VNFVTRLAYTIIEVRPVDPLAGPIIRDEVILLDEQKDRADRQTAADRGDLPRALEDRTIRQGDQAVAEDQDLCRNQRKRGESADLDGVDRDASDPDAATASVSQLELVESGRAIAPTTVCLPLAPGMA